MIFEVLCNKLVITNLMAREKTKIGIIGLGFVGGAARHWFQSQKNSYELYLYDKFKNIGSVEEVNRADYIFIAVPTPYHTDGRGYDDSAVLESLKNIKDGKVAVIKSSVLPGSTDAFQKKFPKKKILFNPEFLTAKNPVNDFLDPIRQLVGYADKKNALLAKKVLAMLPKSPHDRVMKAKEAEMVKFFSNTFLATRVVFANQMHDLCKKLGGVDYDIVKEGVICDKRIGVGHFDVFTDGYRGYSGLCLPKDTRALIQVGEEVGVEMELLKKAEEINNRLQKNVLS